MAQEPISKKKLKAIYKSFEGGLMLKDIIKKHDICRETLRKYLRLKYGKSKAREVVKKNLKRPLGEDSPNWKGGKEITRAGYVRLWFGRHKRISEHRYVIENHLGRKLKDFEVIHHINGIKTDNRLENLEVKFAGEHTTLHNKDLKYIRNERGQFVKVWK